MHTLRVGGWVKPKAYRVGGLVKLKAYVRSNHEKNMHMHLSFYLQLPCTALFFYTIKK